MQSNNALVDPRNPTEVPAAPPTGPLDRNELVRQSLPLVRAIAERLRRRYTLTASFDDLCAMGLTGLAIAINRFDPTRGASFVTFAFHKIRGAILDGLRQTDRQYSFDMRCRKAAEQRAETCGMDGTVGVASALSYQATTHVASACGLGEEDAALDPDELIHQRQVRDRVQEAIASLPDKEREVVATYYYCDGSFADAAARMGISRAWASRLHKRALIALRTSLADLDYEGCADIAEVLLEANREGNGQFLQPSPRSRPDA